VHDLRARVPVLLGVLEDGAVTALDLSVVVPVVEVEAQDPIEADAVGREARADVPGTPRVLPVEVDVSADPERPEVPRIVDLVGPDDAFVRIDLRRTRSRDRDHVPESHQRRVPREADREDGRDPIESLLFDVGAERRELEVVVHSIEVAESDEPDVVAPATARVLLARDDHMHVGVLALSNPVDPPDLGAVELLFAAGTLTVEEDAQRLRSLLCGSWSSGTDEEKNESRGEAREGRKNAHIWMNPKGVGVGHGEVTRSPTRRLRTETNGRNRRHDYRVIGSWFRPFDRVDDPLREGVTSW